MREGVTNSVVDEIETNPAHFPQEGEGRRAVRDIYIGLIRWRAWVLMGWQDIRKRYRRSILGPFWLTLSMGIMVLMLGFLFGNLFKMPLEDFLPFLTLGLLTWGLISGVILDGCQVFISIATHTELTMISSNPGISTNAAAPGQTR